MAPKEEAQIDDKIIIFPSKKNRINGFGALKGISSYDRAEDRMKDRK